jgi:membrane protease YdiL (CAAX protease family)
MLISSSIDKKSALKFFLLIFVLSVPFWLLGTLIQTPSKAISINLPISSLMTFNPLIAALILTYTYNKNFVAIKELLKRAFDLKGIKQNKRYLPIIFFLFPAMMFLAYLVMFLIGLPLPAEPYIPLVLPLILFPIFFIGAVGEEVGWLGYAIDPMQYRWGALKASVIMGSVWGIWHIWPYIQTNNGLTWIIWQALSNIPLRILIVWLYNNTGKSLLAGILFHTMLNVSQFLFPNYGSHYDPFISDIIFASAVAVVIFLSDTRTFSLHSFAWVRKIFP